MLRMMGRLFENENEGSMIWYIQLNKLFIERLMISRNV